jgi:hypothetical protein
MRVYRTTENQRSRDGYAVGFFFVLFRLFRGFFLTWLGSPQMTNKNRTTKQHERIQATVSS